jgi:hypothetical protein
MQNSTARIEPAISAFMQAIESARELAANGALGEKLDAILRQADELLDVVDEELLQLDRERHRHVFLAAPLLRMRLEVLQEELRGRAAH